MSVNYSTGVVYGWKLKQERYDELPNDIKDEYGIQTDYGGDYFVGVKQYGCDCGESAEMNTDCLSKTLQKSSLQYLTS